MMIQELQDAINKRLEKFDGKKYPGKGAAPEYHEWYEGEIEKELESRGIDIFRVSAWKIIAEIEGPGEVNRRNRRRRGADFGSGRFGRRSANYSRPKSGARPPRR